MNNRYTTQAVDFILLKDIDYLHKLDTSFLSELNQKDTGLHDRLVAYRNGEYQSDAVELSEFIINIAPFFGNFLADLFQIEDELETHRQRTLLERRIAEFRQEFVMRRAKRYRGTNTDDFEALDKWLDEELTRSQYATLDRELATACYAIDLLADEQKNDDKIDRLTAWCYLGRNDLTGQVTVKTWNSFKIPQPVDPAHLVSLERLENDPIGRKQGNPDNFRQRDGFALTDQRMELRETLSEVEYCVYCHDHDGDFCSKGFPENKKKPELGLKVNPLGVTLTGCPLEEKISEMHLLKREGHTIAALAVAMIDNPMIPATGHRICNDCMKACIYQKKDPVNIPQIETRVLTDVLDLPWGVEIYDLLTRWNPMRSKQYLMKEYNGRNVLISGMGPAGFTMAHHLTMEGCAVVGIDGLKIEPLPHELLTQPVRDFSSLQQDLGERILAGFGGVAEYGITVRWDKNFLTLIYMTLARRKTFQVFGGARLGGTITLHDAWELGFDHVCIANGAGLPRVISIGNSLARGMRQANDFLMALQLTGAAKNDSLANLQVRMPAAVIGGGLTAIDTATEVQAYYIKQVEKVLWRYEELVTSKGEGTIRNGLNEENQKILDEFLDHGRAARKERERAQTAGEEPNFISLLRKWGGVNIIYRRGLNESPAYQRNHEEVIKALEEGVYYTEGLDPVRCELDEYGHVTSLVCRKLKQEDGRWLATNEEDNIPARSVFVAAGTFPNAIYESEYPGTFTMEHDHFLPHVAQQQGLQPVRVADHCKSPQFGPLTSYESDSRRVSFLGDTHPVFNGSVVKAIASALRSYPEVMQALNERPDIKVDDTSLYCFQNTIDKQFTVEISDVITSHPMVVELLIKAPLAAKNFKPGQFFRLQMYESLSSVVNGSRLQVPLQTISGAGVEGDNVRLVLLRWGFNAKLASRLKPGDKVVLMGPTGAPTRIEKNKTILVVASSWGAAVMLDLGPKLRAAGCRVLYVATYSSEKELYYKEELENTADTIIWNVANGVRIPLGREQDLSAANPNIIDLIKQYHAGTLDGQNGKASIKLKEVDEVLVMGWTGLLKDFQTAYKEDLREYFKPDVKLTGTVGSPMQCMLKGVCAQCLQWQIDPDTVERTRAVFSCSMQDQPLMWIDVDNLSARQGQNRLSEYLTNQWVDYILEIERSVN